MSDVDRPDVDRPERDRSERECEIFDRGVAELALGLLDGPERDGLLAHGSTCTRCRAELDSLTLVADRITVLAPSIEPPTGFESVAVWAMSSGPARQPATSRGSRSGHHQRQMTVVIAAVMALVSLGVGLLIGRNVVAIDQRVVALDRAGVSSLRTGTFVDGSGRSTGTVLATGTALVMKLTDAEPATTYRCEVRLADGSRRMVGTWVPMIGEPTWSVTLRAGLDAALVRSVTLSDLGDAHTATAELSPA